MAESAERLNTLSAEFNSVGTEPEEDGEDSTLLHTDDKGVDGGAGSSGGAAAEGGDATLSQLVAASRAEDARAEQAMSEASRRGRALSTSVPVPCRCGTT